jgi:hypothetical protein
MGKANIMAQLKIPVRITFMRIRDRAFHLHAIAERILPFRLRSFRLIGSTIVYLGTYAAEDNIFIIIRDLESTVLL